MTASSASPTSSIPSPLTPEWLTAALRQSSMLPTGQVTRVEERDNAAFNSAARHQCLTYSPDPPPEMPTRLFFKRNIPEAWAVRAGAREVAFYQVAATMADLLPMVATCYSSAYDEASVDS